jgi:hypothetical protein
MPAARAAHKDSDEVQVTRVEWEESWSTSAGAGRGVRSRNGSRGWELVAVTWVSGVGGQERERRSLSRSGSKWYR